MNNIKINMIGDFGKCDNNENLYHNLAAHRLENIANGLPKEEKSQHTLRNILGFNKEA